MTDDPRDSSLAYKAARALIITSLAGTAVQAGRTLTAAALGSGQDLRKEALSDGGAPSSDSGSGEGKCGAGTCGSDSASEGSSKDSEGKCGEGSCGADTSKKESSPSVKETPAAKDGEGKCGEGTCGD